MGLISKIKITFVALAFAAFFSGCFYDKKSELYPGDGLSNACDTISNMSYANHISPILSSFCISCHSGSFPSGNVLLDNYASVSTYAGTGQLLGTINHISPYNLMPPTAPLNQCQLRQIELWVNAGAPNN
jgi:hypothetical protein